MDSEDRRPFLTIDQLPQPWRGMMDALSAHNDHLASGWFEKIGNGVFEDDHAAPEFRTPHPIYRFRRGELVAYVWKTNDEWLVRPWQRMRGRVSRSCATYLQPGGRGFDVLARSLRPWWRFW